MNPTAPSDACYALIKEFERGPNGDFAAKPYRCPAGHLTIGWGHRLLKRDVFTYPLSAEQAHDLLVADVARAAAAVADSVRVRLQQCMFDALTSFVFNIGEGHFLGSTLLHQLNAGAYHAAADQILRWNKATNKKTGEKEPLAGLTRRRDAERALFLRDGLPQ